MDLVDLLAQGATLPPLRVTSQQARAAGVEPGRLSAKLLQHGSMQLRWYAPRRSDPQVPHDRDELYFIVSGTALFLRAVQSLPFGCEDPGFGHSYDEVDVAPGDALFVPAGTDHRFKAISDDFGAWIVFYGPEGGEAAEPESAQPPFQHGASQ